MKRKSKQNHVATLGFAGLLVGMWALSSAMGEPFSGNWWAALAVGVLVAAGLFANARKKMRTADTEA